MWRFILTLLFLLGLTSWYQAYAQVSGQEVAEALKEELGKIEDDTLRKEMIKEYNSMVKEGLIEGEVSEAREDTGDEKDMKIKAEKKPFEEVLLDFTKSTGRQPTPEERASLEKGYRGNDTRELEERKQLLENWAKDYEKSSGRAPTEQEKEMAKREFEWEAGDDRRSPLERGESVSVREVERTEERLGDRESQWEKGDDGRSPLERGETRDTSRDQTQTRDRDSEWPEGDSGLPPGS